MHWLLKIPENLSAGPFWLQNYKTKQSPPPPKKKRNHLRQFYVLGCCNLMQKNQCTDF